MAKQKSMKKTIIITAIVSLLVGVALTILGYFVYAVVKMQSQVDQNTATISQIVDFLNKATAKSGTTQPTTVVPATTTKK